MRPLMIALMVALPAALPALAQTSTATPDSILSRACGPAKESFNVDLDKNQHTLPAPTAGKARVIFVQDLGTDAVNLSLASYITKVGIDGQWVGAVRSESWFSVDVDPGVHHLCVNAQVPLHHHITELTHFTADAGQTYYFRIRNFTWQALRLSFGPADPDQALYMVATSPQSAAHAKK